MHYFQIATLAAIVLGASAAYADETPVKTFIPLHPSYKDGNGNASPVHFFPLNMKARPVAKLIVHNSTPVLPVKAPEAEADDIPAPRENSALMPMTREQANQILSIFGGND